MYLSGFAGEVIGRGRVPVVISEHLSSFVTGTIGRPQRALARRAYENADLVCPVSDDLGRRLAALAPRARLRTVPNPVDTDRFRPGRRADGGPRVVAVARLDERKGIDHLLRAFARVRERRAASSTSRATGPSARRSRRSRPSCTSTARRVPGHARPRRCRRAHARCRPAGAAELAENLPTVVLEAQACGVPVVATDVGGTREALDPSAGRLVAPADEEALAAAIVAMLVVDHDREAVAARARARYGYDAVAARWEATYRELLAAGARPVMAGDDLALAPTTVYRAKAALTQLRSWRWRVRRRPPAPGLRILFYHRVSDDRDELAVTPARFAAQMARLARDGLRAVDVEEALALLAGGRARAASGCASTTATRTSPATPCRSSSAMASAPRSSCPRASSTAPPPSPGTRPSRRSSRGTRCALSIAPARCASARTPLPIPTSSRSTSPPRAGDRRELEGRARGAPRPRGRRLLLSGRALRRARAALVSEAGFALATSCEPGVNGPDTDPLALRRVQIDARDRMLDFRAKVGGGHDAPPALRAAYRRLRFGASASARS